MLLGLAPLAQSQEEMILLVGREAKVQYLLDDEFTTPLAAGSVNGTYATDGVNLRMVVDTENKLSITGGNLSLLPASSIVNYTVYSPGLHYPTQTRTAGKMMIGSITHQSGIGGVGFEIAGRDCYINNGVYFNGGNLQSGFDGGNVIIGTYANGGTYTVATILRAAGAFFFARGGIYTNPTLLWSGKTGSDSEDPMVTSYTWTSTLNFLRIPQTLWLPPPLASDGFGTAFGTTDGLGHAEGITGGLGSGGAGLAWSQAGDWFVTGGKAKDTLYSVLDSLGGSSVVKGWYDAGDLSTIHLDRSTVSQWDDKSGNANNLVQTDTSKRPLYSLDTEGKHAVRFDAVNDFMANAYSHSGPFSLFAVITPRDIVDQQFAMSLNSNIALLASFWGGAGLVWYNYPILTALASTVLGSSHIVGYTNDGSTANAYADGSLIVSDVTISHDGANLTVGAAWGGGSNWFGGEFQEIIFTKTCLTPTQSLAVMNYLRKKWGTTNDSTYWTNLIFDGNSMTIGQPGPPYPDSVCTKLKRAGYIFDSANVALAGQTTFQRDAAAVYRIDRYLSKSYTKNLIVMWEGTNDLYYGVSSDSAYKNLKTYCAHRKAAGGVGASVVLLTLLPRSDAGISPDFETRRQAVNDSLRNHWASFCDGIVDVAADTTIGNVYAELKTTYFQADHVHMTPIGYARISQMVYNAIIAMGLLPGSISSPPSQYVATVETGTPDVLVSADLTIAGGSAGIVLSYVNADNYVLASHDGTNCKLDKCVAGTWTSVISAAATYSSGATIRCIKDGTSYSLYYNNAKVGSTSTISDAGLIGNTKHGLFSTYSGNTLDNFTIYDRGVDGCYNAVLNKYSQSAP